MDQTKINRRSFLKIGCLSGAAIGATVCGLAAAIPDPSPINLTSHICGVEGMKNRVLLAYATYAGSTIDVAVAISETLGENGFSVDVKPIKEHPGIDGYQAVLIGSPVQHGKWLPEAIDFVKANQVALNQLPVVLFCVHIQNLGDDETSRRNRLAYLDQVRPLLQPAAEGFFAGKFDRRGAKLLLPAWAARFVPSFDLRNWEKIRAWAEDVHPLLQQHP
jgi:menaquinone-dependent protoporphyrinogen oxidase